MTSVSSQKRQRHIKNNAICEDQKIIGIIGDFGCKTEFGGDSVPRSHLRTHYLKLVGIGYL
jgi:hypothetical protein